MLYEKLDYVLAIAEEANLTRAAKKLYISQPTLTMYLNRLEESLGVKLFDRRKNPIQLTDAGAFYIKKMKEISETEQNLRSEILAVAHPLETFTIGIGRVRGDHWLPPLLRDLVDRYPNIRFRAVQDAEGQLLKKLSAGQLDLTIGSFSDALLQSGSFKGMGIKRRLLSKEDVIFIAHKRFHLVPEEYRNHTTPRSPYVLDPELLNGLPFISSGISTGMYNAFQNVLNRYQISPGRMLTVDNLSTGAALVAEGLGVQMISTTILTTLSGRCDPLNLDFIRLPNMDVQRACYLLWAKDSEKTHLIKAADQILRDSVLIHIPFNEISPEDTPLEELLLP